MVTPTRTPGTLLLDFEVEGVPLLQRAFSRFGAGVKDMRPAFIGIGDDFQRVEEDLFQSEGASGGKRWAPLSQPYAQRKAAAFPGKTILRRSDRLWRSLTGTTSDTVREIKKDRAAYGTKVPYGRIHHGGRGNNPRRLVIQLSEKDRRSFTKIAQRYLVDIAKREGLIPGTRGATSRASRPRLGGEIF